MLLSWQVTEVTIYLFAYLVNKDFFMSQLPGIVLGAGITMVSKR